MLIGILFIGLLFIVLGDRLLKGAKGKELTKDDLGIIIIAAPFVIVFLWIILTFK